MKTSPNRYCSHPGAAHLNKAICVGSFVIFLGLATGGVIMASPESFGVAPANAQATSLALSIASLVAGAIFLAVGIVQKLSDKTPAGCASAAQD